jgi:hypothetical protein
VKGPGAGGRRRRARAVLLVLGLAGCRPADPLVTNRDVGLDYSDRSVELLAGVEATQVFVAEHDNLSAAAVMLSNNGGQARDCEVVLRLRAHRSTADIAEQTIPCWKVPAHGWVRMEFPPLVYTRRKRFVLSIESPNARAGQAPLVLMASVPDIYPEGRLRFGGTVVEGALRFMVFHH